MSRVPARVHSNYTSDRAVGALDYPEVEHSAQVIHSLVRLGPTALPFPTSSRESPPTRTYHLIETLPPNRAGQSPGKHNMRKTREKEEERKGNQNPRYSALGYLRSGNKSTRPFFLSPKPPARVQYAPEAGMHMPPWVHAVDLPKRPFEISGDVSSLPRDPLGSIAGEC
jgi:hypothetical protein